MTVPFVYNFRSLPYNFPMSFLSLISHISLPRLGYFIFRRKQETEIFGFKNVIHGERNLKNSYFRNTLNRIKNFQENKTVKTLLILKRLKFPQDDRTDTNFIAPLRMCFQRSISTLNNLKSDFKVFRRKPSLGAPEISQNT